MLRLYRWHSAACKQQLQQTYKKLKPPAQRRAIREYITCNCPIWLTGSTNTETYPRQATGLRDWTAAEALKRSREAGAKDTAVHGPTLAHCAQEFLAAHAENVGARALGQYKRVLDLLQEFAHGRNKHFMQELNVDLLESFKTHALAGLASTSKAGAVGKLKFFLSEAYTRGWIKEALALKVKSVVAVYEEKKPFTEEEVTALLAEAGKLNGGTKGYARIRNERRDFSSTSGVHVRDRHARVRRGSLRSDEVHQVKTPMGLHVPTEETARGPRVEIHQRLPNADVEDGHRQGRMVLTRVTVRLPDAYRRRT